MPSKKSYIKIDLPRELLSQYKQLLFDHKYYNEFPKKLYAGDNKNKYGGLTIKEYRKKNCLRRQNNRFYHPTKNNLVYNKKTKEFRQTKTKFNTKAKDYQLFSLERLQRLQRGIDFPKPFWR